ncbi:MAG: S1/P1 nuclease [Polaribacter sp.]|jgi:hypothetical protein|nr:S1/P1 nuclease [Polaribacter sp.]
MNIKFFSIVFFLLFSNISENKSIFWGKNGHRATGQIAEEYLTKRAKKKINQILNGQSLAFVSTYADEIKSDKRYNKYYSWHYINMNLDDTYASAEKNPKGDLVTGIQTCIRILKDKKTTNENKEFHLKMLVHFLGDLHQPLHIGRPEDRGGNDIQLKWFGSKTNLHVVWDHSMIDEWGMSYLELARNAKSLSKKQIQAIEKGSLIDWVDEVHELTVDIYNSVESGQNLRYSYSYENFGIVRTQLQKGGIRLAKLLNEIFD